MKAASDCVTRAPMIAWHTTLKVGRGKHIFVLYAMLSASLSPTS